MTSDALLDAAPGPSPWYLRNVGPRAPGYVWVAAQENGENFGITLLQGDSGTLMLSPLTSATDALCALMRTRKLPILTHGLPLFEFALPTVTIDERIEVQFPDELKNTRELLVLCSSSAIQPGPQFGHGNLALMVANPTGGSIKLYPQDWFNDGRVDLGYQWVTRVARDPRTGRIRGDGIRISPFTLDDTLRNLERQV